MLSGVAVALRVITAPNSAFAYIRDNDGAYFRWSVCIFALSCLLTGIVLFVLYPYVLPLGDALLQAGLNLLAGAAVVALVYLIGRLLGGSDSWRKVFSTLFYTNVILFPTLIVFAGLASISGGIPALASMSGASMLVPLSMAPLDGAGQPGFTGSGPWTGAMANPLAHLVISITTSVALVVWYVVVSVKAIKTVNGFGTARAFGLLVAANVAYHAAFLPFSI